MLVVHVVVQPLASVIVAVNIAFCISVTFREYPVTELIVFADVETGSNVANPEDGQVVFTLLLVLAPGDHTSSPELVMKLQTSERSIVIETLYGPTPPAGFTVIVEV